MYSFIIFASVFMSSIGYAYKGVSVIKGYGLTSEISGETNTDVKSDQYSFEIFYTPTWKRRPLITYQLGSHMQFSNIEYKVSDINKRGLHSMYGLYAGSVFPLDLNIGVSLNYALYPFSTLIVTHYSESQLNDQRVSHSSLSRYTGSLGHSIRMSAYYDHQGWPFGKTAKIRYGLGSDYFFQNYTKKKDEVFISDADIGPYHTQETYDVDMEISYLNLNMFMGFTF